MRGYEDEVLQDDNLLRSMREQKQHTERGIEVLLKHFTEEGKYFDDLRCLGSKYQTRMKEFQNLIAENSDLKLETRKLQDQLNLLRSSLQDSGFKEEEFLSKISVDRGRPQSTINAFTFQSSRQAKRSVLDQISKMKEEARQQYSSYNKEYDELMTSVLHFLEMSFNTKSLLSEIRPDSIADSSEQMVRVPKQRYELLIEMYAMNMADLQAKKLQKQLQSKKEVIQNLTSQFDKQLQEKYLLMKEENLQTGNLHLFFKRLSQRLGFEKEWQRYHLFNTEEAVNLNSRLNKIIQNPFEKTPQTIKMEEVESSLQMMSERQLAIKLNEVVGLLPFSQRQKECWSKLQEKIKKNELIDMPEILKIFKKQKENEKDQLISNFSELLHQTMVGMLTKFNKLLAKKTKNPERNIINKEDFKSIIGKDLLEQSLKQKSENCFSSQLLDISLEIMKSTIEKVEEKMQKHFRFLSNRDIYLTLTQKK